MLNHSKKIESRLVLIAAIFLGILALGFSIFRGDASLVDPFHYGEYFAATVGFFRDVNPPFHPLTIHGALDFIPGLFAEHQWGAENYFLPTFAIYKGLNFFAAISLILISYELTRFKKYQWLLLLAVAGVAPLMVGYRDLILLISLYLFLKINNLDAKRDLSIFLQVSFGGIVAFGIFWSYDRGIAGALSLGAAVLVLLFRNRWYAISLVSFVAAAVILGFLFEVFSIGNYLRDIYILIQNSGEWSYGWQRVPVVLAVFAVIFNSTAISLLISEGLKSKSLTERLPIIVCFSFVSVFMLKIGVNRADLQHIYFGCWTPMLITLFLYEKINVLRMQTGILIGAILAASVALMILLKGYGLAVASGILIFTVLKFKNEYCNKLATAYFGLLIASCFGLITYTSVKALSDGQYTWIKSLSSPANNRLTATEGIVWASDRLQEHAVDCVFDLSNNGVINGLLRRPSCSRFTYPVYAGPKHELILISDLKDASPQALVYSSTYWSYYIDGRDMRKRFPTLDKFILKNYPKEECNHGYCVRYKEF